MRDGSNHIGHGEEQAKIRGEPQGPFAIPDDQMGGRRSIPRPLYTIFRSRQWGYVHMGS